MGLLTKLIGDPTERDVKQFRSVVERINAFEPKMQALSDEELAGKTDEFRKRLGVIGKDLALGASKVPRWTEIEKDDEREKYRADHEEYEAGQRSLNELLPEAFATVREASKRTLGMRYFDVQLIGE